MSKQGYSGKAVFDYYVERYKNKNTGEFSIDEDDDNSSLVEIRLEVTGNAYFAPGKYRNAPEDSYPDESDIEVESIINCDDNSDWMSLLTSDEMNSVKEQLVEYVREDSCCDDDYYEEPDDIIESSDPISEGGRFYPW